MSKKEHFGVFSLLYDLIAFPLNVVDKALETTQNVLLAIGNVDIAKDSVGKLAIAVVLLPFTGLSTLLFHTPAKDDKDKDITSEKMDEKGAWQKVKESNESMVTLILSPLFGFRQGNKTYRKNGFFNILAALIPSRDKTKVEDATVEEVAEEAAEVVDQEKLAAITQPAPIVERQAPIEEIATYEDTLTAEDARVRDEYILQKKEQHRQAQLEKADEELALQRKARADEVKHTSDLEKDVKTIKQQMQDNQDAAAKERERHNQELQRLKSELKKTRERTNEVQERAKEEHALARKIQDNAADEHRLARKVQDKTIDDIARHHKQKELTDAAGINPSSQTPAVSPPNVDKGQGRAAAAAA